MGRMCFLLLPGETIRPKIPQNHWVDWTPVSSSQIHPLKAYWIHDQPLTTDLVSWTEKTSGTLDMVEVEGSKLIFSFLVLHGSKNVYGQIRIHSLKWMVGRWNFLLGWPIFRCELLVPRRVILTHLNESFKFPLIRSVVMLPPRMWREDRVEPSCLPWVNHQQYGNPPGFSQRFCQRFFFKWTRMEVRCSINTHWMLLFEYKWCKGRKMSVAWLLDVSTVAKLNRNPGNTMNYVQFLT